MGADTTLPSGTVSFVFSDIEGSTRLLRRLGDGYADVLERHRELLRAAWRTGGGVEVGTEGDSFLVAFDAADSALDAAVRAQAALAAEEWPPDGEVRVRIGAHTGLAYPRAGDYVALAVHQAHRVMSVAHGGQVIVSEELVANLESASGTDLLRLGPYRVRDFDHPVVLHQAFGAGMPRVQRALRATPAGGHNIVAPAGSFVGRGADLGRVEALVAAGRVVTVVGPGGVGKTRVLVEHGLRARGSWPDGVWLVRLETLEAATLVPGAVADALGTAWVPGAEVWPEVLDHLQGRRALLLFDNCEHLHDACGLLLAELVESCPTVAVLATSRSPLGVQNEAVVRLGPLSELEPSGNPAAVDLFLDRMESGGRELDESFNAAAVGELCDRLDGLPLAIELAAARAAVLTPAEIVAALDRHDTVLQVDDERRPLRQRSLTGLLDWSYELLDPPARQALRRLSLFAASFDLAGAAVACGASDAVDAADTVWSLAAMSLLVTETRDGASRYRLLRTVRDHASAAMDDEERAVASARLADHLLDRVGPDRLLDRTWLGEMVVELDNVRALANPGSPLPEQVRQRLAWSIGRYHDLMDAYASGVEEVTRYADALTSPTPERVALLTLLADLHLRRGALDRARVVMDVAVGVEADTGPPSWDDAGTSRTLGEIALRSGELTAARGVAERGLAQPLSVRGRARLWNLLGLTLVELDDLDGALAAFEAELAAWTELGLETYSVATLTNLAEVSLRLGRHDAAARYQLAALDLAQVMGQTVVVAFSTVLAAHLAAAAADWGLAVELQVAADGLLDDSGYTLYESDRAAREELMGSAAEQLGESLATVMARGASLDLAAVVDATRSLLSARS